MSIEARQIQETLFIRRHIEFHSLAPGIARQIWRMLRTKCPAVLRSALDHIELTYHDVTVFAIPEFKSLEVPRKYYFLW